MQMLGNIFNAVLFVSAIGSVFCILSLFIDRILRCSLPLWSLLCGMLFFCLPLLSPDVRLISPEPQEWRKGFDLACWIWVCGCGILLICDAARSILAQRALREYPLCVDARVHAVCSRCAKIAGLKKVPVLYWGTLDSPICVANALRPAVVLNRAVVEKLTDLELSAVFFHELTHIKRHHVLLERIYDLVCILNWFNPFAWIAKGDFSLHCETDCDSNALRFAHGTVTQKEYARAIIRLLELSADQTAASGRAIGALRFVLTKRRIEQIITKPSAARQRAIAAVLAVSLAVTAAFAVQFSRAHFYPYPAYRTGTEYSTGHNG